MSTLTTRRLSSFAAAFALLISVLVFASPAQAAIGVDLNVNDTTITEGESVTLSWTSTDAITLVASEAWSGNKTTPSDTEIVTPVGTGAKTYTLTATDENGREATDSVTVTVEAAAPDDITPNPVTFPDPCTVVIPTTPNVTYFVDYGDGDTEELEADTYDGLLFSSPEFTVTFFARADQGFSLADGAVTEWDYTASEDCFGGGAKLIKVSATCGKVTFTNVVDETVTVLYGGKDDEKPDGEFTLGAGKSRTVKTDHDLVLYVALDDQEESFQVDVIEVPQDCGSGSDHPTVAPAAGVSESGPGSPMPVLALLGLLTLAATLRLRPVR